MKTKLSNILNSITSWFIQSRRNAGYNHASRVSFNDPILGVRYLEATVKRNKLFSRHGYYSQGIEYFLNKDK